MWVKITGIMKHRELLISHLKNNLKARINETEFLVKEELRPNIREATSKDWQRGEAKDIIAYTMRVDKTATTSLSGISSFPFDKETAKVKFELTHFDTEDENGEKMVWRFDFYEPKDTWLSWKPDTNGMPEFGVDFYNIR